MQKVIIIGGVPFTGKTTLARMLSARLGYSCLSTDDIGSALRAVLPNDPALNPNGARTYEEYYLAESNEKLISDTELHHQRLKPDVLRVIESHLHYSGPIVIEGWSLYPSWFTEHDENLGIIWLVGEHDVIRSRIINDKSFLTGHPQRAEIIERYFERCKYQNSKIEKEALRLGQPIITINASITPDELMEKVMLSFP